MTIRWQRLLLESTIWLAAEVILTSMGMDDLADYGEYHFTSKQNIVIQMIQAFPAV